jgi:serine/threonine protein kinase
VNQGGGGFGRYREIAVLGQGGMARVVLAALPGPHGVQKLLVVKEMLPELAEDSEYVGMFTDEARLASRLDHPNLVQTYELAEANGRYFFVMEYLEGQPLSAVLSRCKRQMPLPFHLRVLTRVLAGLHYAHDLTDLEGRPLGVVHRDVSPQNIFLCYGGAIKLVDFGIAKAAGAAVKTKAGTFKGKIGYSSKEQIANEPVDRRADVFAVGVLLWEALVGHRITKGLEEAAILQRRFLDSEPSVLTANPSADPELAAICDKAMSAEREGRYSTAAELHAALDAYIRKTSDVVADEDVGAFVAGLFAEERSQVRRLVHERLARPASEPASSSFLLAPAVPSSQDSLSGNEPTSQVASADLPIDVTVRYDSATGRLTRKRRVVSVAAVFVALTVMVGGGWLALHRGPSSDGRAGTVDRASSTSTSIPSVSLPSASTEAVAQKPFIDAVFSASPPATRFTLDGRPLDGNPYRGRLPRDGSSHRLEARAPGYVAEQRNLVLDGAVVEVELALEAVARPAGTSPSHPPPAVAPPVDPQSARRPGRPAKPIDTSDPYSSGGGQ